MPGALMPGALTPDSGETGCMNAGVYAPRVLQHRRQCTPCANMLCQGALMPGALMPGALTPDSVELYQLSVCDI